jgi:hypothetical protein
MTKSELKLLIREAVEEVTKMENPCWKGYEAYGTKKKNGKEVPNCVPVNEAMSGEEYAKDIQTSEGVFKYWMEEDREPDNMKLFFYVKGPDGKVHGVDMNPYEYNPYSPENIEKVGGRGIFLMKHLSDEVKFEEGGKKTVLSFYLE